MRLPGLGLILSLLAAAAAPSAWADDIAPIKPSVGLDYKIYVGGIEALAATVTIASDSAHYDIEIKATTGGTLAKLFPWTVHLGSKGNIAGTKLQPVEHRQTSNFQGKDRATFLEYDGHGGFLDRRVVPDNHEDQREDVPADLTHDTLDVVSAVLAGLRNVGQTGSCKALEPVFDGRRRFDLAFSDDGHAMLGPSDIAIYHGDAVRCAIRVQPVAGFFRKNQKSFFTRKVNGEDEVVPIKAYLAPVGAARVEVPVKVETTSALGPLILHLTGIHDNPDALGD